MKITYKGDYALKAILELSLHYGNGPVQIHELAKRTDAPIKFLEQVLLDLKRGGFVESRRGKQGGYLLAKAPAEIKVGDVVRYIDGPLDPIACLGADYESCSDLHHCVLRKIWRQVAEATSNIVDKVTFESLVAQMKQNQEVLEYVI